jgi:hypothetical protein
VPFIDRTEGIAKAAELMKQHVMPLTLGDAPRILLTPETYEAWNNRTDEDGDGKETAK